MVSPNRADLYYGFQGSMLIWRCPAEGPGPRQTWTNLVDPLPHVGRRFFLASTNLVPNDEQIADYAVCGLDCALYELRIGFQCSSKKVSKLNLSSEDSGLRICLRPEQGLSALGIVTGPRWISNRLAFS